MAEERVKQERAWPEQEIGQKTRPETRKEHDELTGRALRIIVKPLVKALRYTSITPNHITLVSIIPALASIFFLLPGSYQDTVIGAVLAFLYVLLDATDGQLAREKNLSSIKGKWLDGILGYIFVPFMMLAVAIGKQDYQTLLVGAVAALSFPIQFTLIYFFNSEFGKGRMELPLSPRWQVLRYAYGLALFFPLLLASALLNRIEWLLWFFAIAGHLFWLLVIALQFRELQRRERNGEWNRERNEVRNEERNEKNGGNSSEHPTKNS